MPVYDYNSQTKALTEVGLAEAGSGSSAFASGHIANKSTYVGNNYYLTVDEDGWLDFTHNAIAETSLVFGIPNIFAPGSGSWEMCFLIRIDQLGNTYNTICGRTIDANYFRAPCIQYVNDANSQNHKHFEIAYSTNGTSWAHLMYSENVYEPGASYYVKMLWDTEYLKFYVSTDGEIWSLECSVEEETPHYQDSVDNTLSLGALSRGGSFNNSIFTCGAINIAKSYIKFGDTVVWGNE